VILMQMVQQLFFANFNQIHNVDVAGKLLRKENCPRFNFLNQGQ